jgi:PST family polysaccharide transporter
MDDQAVKGIPWTFLAYAATKLVTVATTVALARLLVPEDFGLVALAALVVGIVAVFRDFGTGGSLVTTRDVAPRTLGTVLTLIVAAAVLSGVLVAALAPVAAWVFDEPMLTWILLAIAPTLVIGNVAGLYDAMLQRRMDFRRRFWAQVAHTLTLSIVSIGLAVAGAGVWAIVGGQIAAPMVFCAYLIGTSPVRIRPRLDKDRVGTILREGRGFLGQELVTFVHHNADYFAVGRVLGATQLGYYSMAYRLGELPYQAIADPIARVTFPAFAEIARRGEAYARSFLTALRLQALATVPAGLLLSALAEPFTQVVLGEKWLPTAAVLEVLGIWAVIQATQATFGWLLASLRQIGIVAIATAVSLLLLVPGVVLAARFGDIRTVAWVLLGDIALALAYTAFLVRRRTSIGFSVQWAALRPLVVAGAVCWVVARVTSEAIGGPAAVALCAGAVAGAVAYVAAVSVLSPDVLRTAVHQLRRLRAGRHDVAPDEPAQAS